MADKKNATVDPTTGMLQEIDALKSENVHLRTQLDKATAPDAVSEARFQVLEEELVCKTEAIADLEATVAKLSKANEVAPKIGAKALPEPFTIDGSGSYRFTMHACYYKGKKITAAQVRDDQELALELIVAGAGMLEEV